MCSQSRIVLSVFSLSIAWHEHLICDLMTRERTLEQESSDADEGKHVWLADWAFC
jgi:hypothetical protein